MKVKKIACLLTALVISASAAMVPAVANAAAGEEVTVSSTTSYVEKEGGQLPTVLLQNWQIFGRWKQVQQVQLVKIVALIELK